MYRSLFGRRREGRGRRSRALRYLLWIVLLIVLLIVLAQLFGGFRKGTKAEGRVCTSCASVSQVTGPANPV